MIMNKEEWDSILTDVYDTHKVRSSLSPLKIAKLKTL